MAFLPVYYRLAFKFKGQAPGKFEFLEVLLNGKFKKSFEDRI